MGLNHDRYYRNHREEIIERNREYQKAYKKKKKEEGTTVRHYTTNPVSSEKKKFIKPFKEKFKGFLFKYDGEILTIDIKLPFRCVITDDYGVNHCDEKTIEKLQKEIRIKIGAIHKHQHLIVIDCNSIQLYLKNTDNLDEICTIVREFVLEKLKIYGRYKKNGKLCNADFQ